MFSNVIDNYNQFAVDLYKASCFDIKSTNVLVSPHGILTALNLCYMGSKNNTERQLAKLLNYIDLSKDQIHNNNAYLTQSIQNISSNNSIDLIILNKLFSKRSLKLNKDYMSTLQKYYDNNIEFLEYNDANLNCKQVNDLIDSLTNNKIKNCFFENQLNDVLSLLLINVTYFKASWAIKFNKVPTTKNNFYLSDGRVIVVDMMLRNSQKFKYIKEFDYLNASICEVPFAGKQISMTIVLPNEGVNISSIENVLDNNVLKNIFEMNQNEVKVNVMIPKFKFEQTVELSKIISNMGAKDAFNQRKADFTGISEHEKSYLSKILNKIIIEISEEGMETSTSSNALMILTQPAIVSRPSTFNCDRPFLFIIHDNQTHMILFIGKYEGSE